MRIGSNKISEHAFFKAVVFAGLLRKEIDAPFIPPIRGPTDTSNFEEYDGDGGDTWVKFVAMSSTTDLFEGF